MKPVMVVEKQMRIRYILFVLMIMAMAAPAAAQVDIAGEWGRDNHEDQPHRAPGAEVGDYTGIALNDAGRLKADTWNASVLSQPEQQAKPHPAQYSMRGPGPQVRISKVVHPVSGQLIAYTLAGFFGRADRVIYMDGRAHPSEYAEHMWHGFSTGEWDGDQLVITTTHIKYGVVRRNGVPASPEAVVTERWVRYGGLLMVVMHVDDPVYLDEPLVRTNVLRSNPGQHTGRITPFEVVDEVLTRQTGNVPHYPLGVQHRGFGQRVGLPFELTQGGAETMYPEYQQRVDELLLEFEGTQEASND